MTRSAEIGFYGKVRTHGDFVGRGLPQAFVEFWDGWLQRGMLAARERLGDAWLESYLVMPLWCFVLQGSGVDDYGYAGVMVPGLDAVGRYFPFVIAKRIDPDATAQWRGRGGGWGRHVGPPPPPTTPHALLLVQPIAESQRGPRPRSAAPPPGA